MKLEIEERQGYKKEPFDTDELARAVIVLKIAAMDMFFTDKFVELFIPFVRHNGGSTSQLDSIIKDAGVDLTRTISFMLLPDPMQALLQDISPQIRRYIAQNISKIDALFQAFGIPSISNYALKYDGDPDLLSHVIFIIRRRHSIAHGADCSKQSVKRVGRGTLNKIDYIDKYVSACNFLLDSHIKNGFPADPKEKLRKSKHK